MSRWISIKSCLAASLRAKVSMTATPVSPITTPAFEPLEGCAFGLSTAAHTFGATCLSVNGDCRRAQCAQSKHTAAKSKIGAVFIAATGRSHTG